VRFARLLAARLAVPRPAHVGRGDGQAGRLVPRPASLRSAFRLGCARFARLLAARLEVPRPRMSGAATGKPFVEAMRS
jgi:hypothetical protein